MKTPSFYRHKPHEIERSFLTFVPEAPRVSPDVATDWEALSDESGDGKVVFLLFISAYFKLFYNNYWFYLFVYLISIFYRNLILKYPK